MAALRWLRENGCPWDSSACYVAISNGHIDVVRWLLSEGAPSGIKEMWSLQRHDAVNGDFRAALDRRVYPGIKPLYIMYILTRMSYGRLGDVLL